MQLNSPHSPKRKLPHKAAAIRPGKLGTGHYTRLNGNWTWWWIEQLWCRRFGGSYPSLTCADCRIDSAANNWKSRRPIVTLGKINKIEIVSNRFWDATGTVDSKLNTKNAFLIKGRTVSTNHRIQWLCKPLENYLYLILT